MEEAEAVEEAEEAEEEAEKEQERPWMQSARRPQFVASIETMRTAHGSAPSNELRHVIFQFINNT